MRARGRTRDLNALPRLAGSVLDPRAPFLWTEGHEILGRTSIVIPFELVHTAYTLPLPTASGAFQLNDSGVASGNPPLEATSHAICELVERDAVTLWTYSPRQQQQIRKVNVRTVDDEGCQSVLDKFASAGIRAGVWDVTTDTAIPAFVCMIADDPSTQHARPLASATGSGCHPSRSIAILRALTEAAQTRLTIIAGSRDDLSIATYRRGHDPTVASEAIDMITATGGGRRYSDGPSYAGASFHEDVAWELEQLRAINIEQIAVVDLTRFRTRRQIPLDAAPSQVLARPKTTQAYVLAPGNGTIYEVEASLLTITRRVRAGNTAIAMRLSRDGKALWVLYRDPAGLVEIPFESMRPGRRIRLPAPPVDFDLCRETDEACVVATSARTIAVVSLAKSSVSRTIQAATEPSIARFRMDGSQLITGSQADRSLTIYDVPTGKTVVRLPLSIAPREFCFTADGGHLYVSGDGMDAVVSVFPYRTEVWETLLAGHAPGAMAIAESDRPPAYLLVANPDADRVTVLDVEKGNLVADVETGCTEVPGVYAAGDVAAYPGKVKLIACGFGEAAIAVNNAAAYLKPGASVFPGHSSNQTK